MVAMTWLHVPKAGSTWINTLLATVCGDELESRMHQVRPSSSGLKGFVQRLPNATIRPCLSGLGGARGTLLDLAHHTSMGQGSSLVDTGVTLLRDPKQRLMSSFHYRQVKPYDRGQPVPTSLLEFDLWERGCVVKMLARSGVNACGHSPPNNHSATLEEVDAAKGMLSRFLFVGLTDEYNLSLCLWHHRFGPRLAEQSEFLNTRTGPVRQLNGFYNISTLGDDPYDGPLYEHARSLFWASFRRANLSQQTCDQWRTWCLSNDKGKGHEKVLHIHKKNKSSWANL